MADPDMWQFKALSKAVDTFEGDLDRAADWMNMSNLALDQQNPRDVAKDASGYDRVVTVLTRIDHGIFS